MHSINLIVILSDTAIILRGGVKAAHQIKLLYIVYRCIPLSLRSKTRRKATLLLPTWICSCQSVGTVNFALPFTTNVTISISILQTFRS